MLKKYVVATVLVFAAALPCSAQEDPESTPVELEVMKASVGVWDAETEDDIALDKPDARGIAYRFNETAAAATVLHSPTLLVGE